MFRRSGSRLLISSLCVILLLHSWLAFGLVRASNVKQVSFSLTVDPSAVTIKVGDSAFINLTTISAGISGSQVCYSEQGFPSSGFNLTFLPECTPLTQLTTRTILIVGATPAAAPQNFTAAILAISGNETASAPLTITVVPAIAPWIPWLGILLFFVVIGLALFVGPRRSKKTKPKNL
jgi:hypothetical protein